MRRFHLFCLCLLTALGIQDASAELTAPVITPGTDHTFTIDYTAKSSIGLWIFDQAETELSGWNYVWTSSTTVDADALSYGDHTLYALSIKTGIGGKVTDQSEITSCTFSITPEGTLVDYTTDGWKSRQLAALSHTEGTGLYTITGWYGTRGYDLTFTLTRSADGLRDSVIIDGSPDPSGFSSRRNYVAYMADPSDKDGGLLYKSVVVEQFEGDAASAYGKFLLNGSEHYEFVWGGHEIPATGGGEDPDQPDADDDLPRLQAWTADMSGTNAELEGSQREITYVYNEETQVYTFDNLIVEGAKVKFHVVSPNSNVNNIRFDNARQLDESFTCYLPDSKGEMTILVAVMGHFDYTSALKTFNTGFDPEQQTGYIVVLDGSRDKIKRVVAFGTGVHGAQEIQQVANIAAFKAKAKRSKSVIADARDRASVYQITGPVTCITDYSPNASWYYVQDETGTLGIYVNHSYPLGAAQSYQAGDLLTGITGYSVGTDSTGFQMEVDHEQFYVYDYPDHRPEMEYTRFPAASGKAEILPPYQVSLKSEISAAQLHDYVKLHQWTYIEESTVAGDQHPAYLQDAEGHNFELTWDYVLDLEETANAFTQSVKGGTVGDYIGFIANNAKNFVIYRWDLSAESLDTISHSPATATKVLRDGHLYLHHHGYEYNALGQRVW